MKHVSPCGSTCTGCIWKRTKTKEEPRCKNCTTPFSNTANNTHGAGLLEHCWGGLSSTWYPRPVLFPITGHLFVHVLLPSLPGLEHTESFAYLSSLHPRVLWFSVWFSDGWRGGTWLANHAHSLFNSPPSPVSWWKKANGIFSFTCI